MKKLLLPVMVLSAFFFASCDGGDDTKDPPGKTPEEIALEAKLATVPEKQTGLLIKHTGTKCYYCGTWGWVAMEAAVAKYKGDNPDAVVIGAYGSYGNLSQDFISTYATQLGTSDGVTGIPSFFANGTVVPPSGSNDQERAQAVLDGAEYEYILAKEDGVKVNGALKWSVADNRATGTYRVRFFDDLSGEYTATVWFDESELFAPQAGYTGSNPIHHHALRQCATSNVYGETVASGDIAKNTVLDFDFDVEFPTSQWKVENTTATVVIWRKIASKYKFVNCSQATFE